SGAPMYQSLRYRIAWTLVSLVFSGLIFAAWKVTGWITPPSLGLVQTVVPVCLALVAVHTLLLSWLLPLLERRWPPRAAYFTGWVIALGILIALILAKDHVPLFQGTNDDHFVALTFFFYLLPCIFQDERLG